MFLEDSVSQVLGHRIWDTIVLSTPTVRIPLPLYADGAGMSGGLVRRIWRASQLHRVVQAARAAAAARCLSYGGGSGGRVVRPSRGAGGLGWPGREDVTKGEPGATGSRGERSACGSG